MIPSYHRDRYTTKSETMITYYFVVRLYSLGHSNTKAVYQIIPIQKIYNMSVQRLEKKTHTKDLSKYIDLSLYLSQTSDNTKDTCIINDHNEARLSKEDKDLSEIDHSRFCNTDNGGSEALSKVFDIYSAAESPSSYQPDFFNSQFKKRRAIKPWSKSEFEALGEGMETYGTHWAMIKSDIRFSEILKRRTIVDLKDKARVERNARSRKYGASSNQLQIFSLVSGKGGEGAFKYTPNL